MVLAATVVVTASGAVAPGPWKMSKPVSSSELSNQAHLIVDVVIVRACGVPGIAGNAPRGVCMDADGLPGDGTASPLNATTEMS